MSTHVVRRLAAAVPIAALVVLAAAPAHPATAAPAGPTAFFIGSDGAPYAYGADTRAVAIGPRGQAPAGAGVAAVRTADGAGALFVGNDGAVHASCAANGSNSVASAAGLAPAGSSIAAASAGGTITVAVVGAGGSITAGDVDDGNWCGTPPPWPWPHWWHFPQPRTELEVGSDIALVAPGDGSLGAFVIGGDGAVRAEWRTPDGGFTDSALTGAGAASPGGGLAVLPAPKPGAPMLLAYSGLDGAIWLVHPAPGGGGDEPRPISPADLAVAGGQLTAVGSAAGAAAISFVGRDGAVYSLVSTASGQWQGSAVTGAGFAEAGISVAGSGSASDYDDYCGNGKRVPGLIHIHFGGGPGNWVPAGPAGLAGLDTGVAVG